MKKLFTIFGTVLFSMVFLAVCFFTTSYAQNWTQVNTDGFGDTNNEEAGGIIAIYNDCLYVGTGNGITGCEIWQYCGSTWSQINTDGFGNTNNHDADDMILFNDYFYVGAGNDATGCEVWRTAAVGGPPFTDWTQVNTNGFGDINNGAIDGMTVYNGSLYMGTYNETSGCEVWSFATTDDGGGNLVTSDLWIKAVINTVEKGPIEAVWQKGGEDTTSRGDRVIWGHFYASPNDVTWGSQNNPDLFVKIWFDISGRIDVNYFHVSVPEIEVYSDYPYDGTVDEQGTTTMNTRYIRQYYENGQSHSEDNYEDGVPAAGYSQTGNPSGYSTINNLRIGSMINTVEKGPIDAVWRLGGQDTTSRGDQVVWGHYYANPSDVTWGSQDNPDLFVKIWFDVSGRVDVNFFHVSVPDIEVYSDLPNDATYDQQGTTIMADRYIRHEYWQGYEGIDNDGDGYTENQGDCDDNDASIYPGAPEICGDGIDQDCNGSDLNCNNDGSIIGIWHLSTVNGQPLPPGIFLTWSFTENTITIRSDLDCVEVFTYETSGGVLTGTSVISQVGSECGDEDDEDGLLGQYSIMGNTLTVVIEDPELDPPTATFVFTKAT